MAFKRISTGARLTDRTAYSTVYNQNYNFDMTLHGQIVRRYGDVTPIGWRATVQYIDYSNRYHRATAEQANSSLPGYVGINVDVS